MCTSLALKSPNSYAKILKLKSVVALRMEKEAISSLPVKIIYLENLMLAPADGAMKTVA